MNDEIMKELDTLLHKIGNIATKISQERDKFNAAQQDRINDLMIARSEVLKIIEMEAGK